MLIPFGERDGRLHEVAQVPRGLACGCYCPSCHTPLQARQGEKVAWHFSHHPDYKPSVDTKCTGHETALHEFAKQCLVGAGNKILRLPPMYGSTYDPVIKVLRGTPEQLIPQTTRRVDVLLEGVCRKDSKGNWEENRIVPLGVEIYVTNPKGLNFCEELRIADQLSVIEIRLTKEDVAKKMHDYPLEIGWASAVKMLIMGHSRNRRWLYWRNSPHAEGSSTEYLVFSE